MTILMLGLAGFRRKH
ncbi:GlyGly-CTERM sorting domain-containing protein [Vibrio parahaemolyticus]